MGFVQKLRMNNLYPGGGITPPAMPQQIDFNELLGMRESENLNDLNRQTNVLKPRVEQIGRMAAPPPTKPLNIAPPNYGQSQIDKWKQEDFKNRGQDIAAATAQGKLDVIGQGLDIKREGLGIQKDLGQQRIDAAQENNQGKLTLADWKARHPNGKIVIPKGGNVVMIDPITGEAHDTGISSGTLTDKERIEATGQQARDTKTTIPGRAVVNSNADLPTQQKVGTQLTAQKLMNTHPEWKNFIKIDPNSGLVMVTPPGNSYFGMGGGPDKAVYDQINQALYPAKSTPTEKPLQTKVPEKTSEQTSPMEKVQRNSKGETRTVVSTDGGKTWTPKK